MTYLTRPVFKFPVNWAADISRSFTLDLRQVALGFGAEVFTSRQQFVVSGWSLRVELAEEQDISDFDGFFDALSGRLQGFWLPIPMEAAQITSSISSTQFNIRDQRLRDAWSASPDVHLYFTGNGLINQAAKIVAVTDNGDRTEKVTVTPAMSQAASVQHAVSRLHYVRLADDSEKSTILRENYQTRTLRVVELPQEYTTAELGESPIYLYHFFARAPIDYHWYFTSFAGDVFSGNKRYTAASITHGELRKSMKFESESVEIRAAFLEDHPLTLFLPFPPGRPIWIEIRMASLSDPDTASLLFTGQIRRVNDNGTLLVAQCDNFISILKQRIPPMVIKKDCDYQLFDVRTCKAPQAFFQTTGHITAIDNTAQPPTVECSLRFPTFPTSAKLVANYFAQGWIETGQQLDFEVRTVFSSTWNSGTSRLLLTLNGPLLRAVVGQEIEIMPGCDGLAATCVSKFDNFEHFPGFVDVPNENPSLAAIEAKTSAGDKK